MAHQTKESNWVDELLDKLLADGHSPEAVLGENGLLKQQFQIPTYRHAFCLNE